MCGRRAIGGRTHAQCERRYGMDGLRSVFAYDGVVRKGIKKLKFRFVTDLVDELAGLAIDKWDDGWWEEYLVKGKFVVVAVPLHAKRERWRGFNQAGEVGKRLEVRCGLEFWEKALVRVRETESQSEIKAGLTKREEMKLRKKSVSRLDYDEKKSKLVREKLRKRRRENVKGAFELSAEGKAQREKLGNRNILLIDDVWTTGSTMKECAKVLKRVGVGEVWGFTVAR